MKHEVSRQRIIMNLKEYLETFCLQQTSRYRLRYCAVCCFFIPDNHRRKALSKPQTKQINADDITFNFRDETKRTGDGKLKNPPRFPSATIRRFLFLLFFIPFYPRFFSCFSFRSSLPYFSFDICEYELNMCTRNFAAFSTFPARFRTFHALLWSVQSLVEGKIRPDEEACISWIENSQVRALILSASRLIFPRILISGLDE